jgi:hypothetical protein
MPTIGQSLAGIFIDRVTNANGMLDDSARYEVFFESPAWRPAMEWCEFHGIDPHRVLAGTEIIRDAGACAIRYTRIVVVDADGGKVAHECGTVALEPVVEQGEAPPLPFPHEVVTAGDVA